MSYQRVTGPLMANSHPGSYCGQDAYSDMFVTEKKNESDMYRKWAASRCADTRCGSEQNAELSARPNENYRGGGTQMDTVVRRLTPLECTRLQGFPDGWCDIGDWTDEKGKVHKESDTPKYKALGNSVAIPFWFWLLRRISAEYETPATMGSLFSGIGGFDLAWSRCNGSGSVLWSSEIESYPIAVMRKHFGDEDLGIEGDIRKYL